MNTENLVTITKAPSPAQIGTVAQIVPPRMKDELLCLQWDGDPNTLAFVRGYDFEYTVPEITQAMREAYASFCEDYTAESVDRALRAVEAKHGSLDAVTVNYFLAAPQFGGLGVGVPLPQEKKHETIEGNFTTLTYTDNALKITITDQGREELLNSIELRPEWCDEAQFEMLLEEHTTNGNLEAIRPKEIGALTRSLIFAREVERDDDGELTNVIGAVYWFPNYQICGYTDVLIERGELVFDAGPKEAAPVSVIECGCCGAFHRVDYRGDCRNDAERFADLEDAEKRLGSVVEVFFRRRAD